MTRIEPRDLRLERFGKTLLLGRMGDGSLYAEMKQGAGRIMMGLAESQVDEIRELLSVSSDAADVIGGEIVEPSTSGPSEDDFEYYRRQDTILQLLDRAVGGNAAAGFGSTPAVGRHSLTQETANAVVGLALYIERGADVVLAAAMALKS